ncbi:MAG: C40 family peptidase [Coprobacter sp.]|nr:C40 family peptidase [Coprobacter sp.]
MQKAIAKYPVIPMRKAKSETSEMVNQLIYGEAFTILQEEDRWSYVESAVDGYRGWIDRKMTCIVDEAVWQSSQETCFIVSSPFAEIYDTVSGTTVILSSGSRLPSYDDTLQTFSLGPLSGRLIAGSVIDPRWRGTGALLNDARKWLNAPYMWGGRHILGTDCSGFIQTVFAIQGIKLPRDARDQALCGRRLAPDEVSAPGDLAFFSDAEGRVVHVGIVITPSTLIHSSGSVRIDTLDERGIYRKDFDTYTHTLHSRCRLVE